MSDAVNLAWRMTILTIGAGAELAIAFGLDVSHSLLLVMGLFLLLMAITNAVRYAVDRA